MTDWIKYDGTNKPDDDALVRIRFRDGWEQPDFEPNNWSWHDPEELYAEDAMSGGVISHFQLKDKEND